MRKPLFAVTVFVVSAGLLFTTSAVAQTSAATPPPIDPAAKAKVVFYYSRPVPMKGCMEQVAILIDSVPAHTIGQWHVWQTQLAPGTHILSDDSHRDKGESVTVAAGQTYYYEIYAHKSFGFPTCPSFWAKFQEMKPKDVPKATVLLGKPGADETAVAAAVSQEPARPTTVKLAVISIPEAADIEIDGNFMGNTPSAIELSPGEHTIVVSKKGFKSWQRKIKLAAGDIKINAELESDAPKQ